jgi:hypothetical protein
VLPNIEKIDIEPAPIDFHRLDTIAETKLEKKVILELFYNTFEEVLAEMKSASCNDKPLSWKEAAHTLRGAAANMGMTPLEELCLESERISWTALGFRNVLLQKIYDEIARIKTFVAENHPFLPAPKMKSCPP